MLDQLIAVVLHSLPVACVAWTMTHEEVFRDWWELAGSKADAAKSKWEETRSLGWWACHKFCYLFTCEYCFSHWVALGLMLLTGFRILYDGFTGHLLAFFAVVWTANLFMGIHQKFRVQIRKDRADAKAKENSL